MKDPIFEAAAKASPGPACQPEISASSYPETVFFYWLGEWSRCWIFQALVSGAMTVQQIDLSDIEGLAEDIANTQDSDPEDFH